MNKDKPRAWVKVDRGYTQDGPYINVVEFCWLPDVKSPWMSKGAMFYREDESDEPGHKLWRLACYGPSEMRGVGTAEHILGQARVWAKDIKWHIRNGDYPDVK